LQRPKAERLTYTVHIEEFKNMLNTEVARNMQELTQMQEQKRTLELQLSDYFALMAKTNKTGDGGPVSSFSRATMLLNRSTKFCACTYFIGLQPKAAASLRTPFKNPLPLPPTSPMQSV